MLFYLIFIIWLFLIIILFKSLQFSLHGVRQIQGDHNFNNSILFIKPENLTKTELVEKFKELSSSKSLENLKDNKIENKISIKDLLKSLYLKLSGMFIKFYGILIKITLFSIFIRIFRKIKILRFVLTMVNSILFSIFGIVFSDVYGFKEILDHIIFYWNEYVNFIHETKFYKVLIKILKIFKELDVEKPSNGVSGVKTNPKSDIIENIKIDVIENIKTKESNFPSRHEENTTYKSNNFENDRSNIGNSSEINKPFYRNTYFLITVSIVSISLIYYYWGNISELLWNLKKDKPGDGSYTPRTYDLSELSISPITDRYMDKNKDELMKKYFNVLPLDENIELEPENGKVLEYGDVETSKWNDSPTTPKPSSSKLTLEDIPKKEDRLMIPTPKK